MSYGRVPVENAHGTLAETPHPESARPLRTRLPDEARVWNHRSLGARTTQEYRLVARQGDPPSATCRERVTMACVKRTSCSESRKVSK